MFQLLKKQPSFDFMKRGPMLLGISFAICLVCLVLIGVRGVNLGVEFAGGSELQLKFRDAPDVGQIRSTLGDSGLGSAVVTTIGSPEKHEIYVKIASTGDALTGEDLTRTVTDALRAGAAEPGREDLNIVDVDDLERVLRDAPNLDASAAATVAQAITDHRDDVALFHSVDDLAQVESVTPEVLEHLRARTFAGPLVLRSQSYIGPAIGKELMRNALGAIFGSLLGMLVYIWIRFQLQWGFAAVLALAHDVVITLGLFVLFDKEMTLPVVAAFLTLVGYSVNDTVVVFDRIRENLRLRGGSDLQDTINLSINQTLSRTIITSGLTFIVVFVLFLFGGGGLNAFAFVLTAGVVVGTYSSIYIASPVLVIWKRFLEKRAGASSAGGTRRRARKVRTG